MPTKKRTNKKTHQQTTIQQTTIQQQLPLRDLQQQIKENTATTAQQSPLPGLQHQSKKNTVKFASPKLVDLLEVDKPIAGQNFGCFSFVSPETVLKQKDQFFFEQFLKKWEINKSMEKFHQFLNFVSFKYKIVFEDLSSDFNDFIKEENALIVQSSISDDYKTFLDKEEDALDKQFSREHEFKTSVRGFKARGNFSTQEEAELRAKLLRETDPHFDVYVGPIGTWLPWEPEAYKTGRVEYMEEELNQLVHEKMKNETAAKNAFEQRVKETKQQAIEENKKNADKYGNMITQDIDKDGNLIGVDISKQNTDNETNDTEENNELYLEQSITVADIRRELFEGDNIVVGKTDYGRSELLSAPF